MITDQALEPAIRVQGIEKSFKDVPVLRGVDFDVAAGTIFALLGSNGAGKTTLVRILSTLLKADAGTAMVHGFDVAARPGDVRESISLTGQFTAVDDVLTGRENLVLIAQLRHLKNPASIAEELLNRFSLTEAGSRAAATYSGGMRRRLDIAMSLIGNPPIIFLDEPTTGLDPQSRIEVWQTITTLAGQGTTLLLTHAGTSRRPSTSPTGSRSCTAARSSTTAPSPSSGSSCRPPRSSTSRSSPTLEDVFLSLVGETSKNAETAAADRTDRTVPARGEPR